MTCPNCGSALKVGTRFCAACGLDLTQVAGGDSPTQRFNRDELLGALDSPAPNPPTEERSATQRFSREELLGALDSPAPNPSTEERSATQRFSREELEQALGRNAAPTPAAADHSAMQRLVGRSWSGSWGVLCRQQSITRRCASVGTNCRAP